MKPTKHMLNNPKRKRTTIWFKNSYIFSLMCTLSIIISCSFSACHKAEPKYEYRKWEFSDGAIYAVAQYIPAAEHTEIEIPHSYKGYDVQFILDGAFARSKIESLTMTSIIKIYPEAFAFCDKLVTLNLGCVETIGRLAFGYCTALEKVVFPKSVETIEIGAFSDCKKLKAVYFEGNPENLSKDIFPPGVVIYGTPGGTVELYAKQYGYEFRIINP